MDEVTRAALMREFDGLVDELAHALSGVREDPAIYGYEDLIAEMTRAYFSRNARMLEIERLMGQEPGWREFYAVRALSLRELFRETFVGPGGMSDQDLLLVLQMVRQLTTEVSTGEITDEAIREHARLVARLLEAQGASSVIRRPWAG